MSAGLRQGGKVNSLRGAFLARLGVSVEEIEAHESRVFGDKQGACDLVLVAERWMQKELLRCRPQLAGRVMTIRGFARGLWPETDTLSEAEAHIEDAGGHDEETKLTLYAELEGLAEQLAQRLLAISYGPVTSTESAAEPSVQETDRGERQANHEP